MRNAENNIDSVFKKQAESAIKGLEILQIKLELKADYAQKPREPLSGAIENLHFVNENIAEIVGNFFNISGKSLQFSYFPQTPEGSRPFSYHTKELPNKLSYATALGRRPALLSEQRLRIIWNANQNRKAVEALGKLSKKELIEKFRKHIVAAMK